MSIITSIIEKKLENVENTYALVNHSLINYVGPLSDSKKKEIGTTLLKSYLYLSNQDIFNTGLLKILPSPKRKEYLDIHPDITEEYQSLIETYYTPYKSLNNYINHLDEITSERINKYNRQIANFNTQIAEFAREYIDFNTKTSIIRTFTPIFDEIKKLKQKELFKEPIAYFDTLDAQISALNKNFIEHELIRTQSLLSDIDGKSLDDQQRLVVVTSDSYVQALAGAGSGKTLTIAAKAKYLVEYKKMNPKDILLISFTKKSAEEMAHRISHKLKLDVEVKTFHKLGLEIISRSLGYKPDILEDASALINGYFKKEILENSEVLDAIIDFLSYFLKVPTTIDDSKNFGEFLDESSGFDDETIRSKYCKIREDEEIEGLKQNRITIQKETVKSLEEVQIANFLYLNGIEYEYERPYEFDTKTPDKRQYKPDFYLPEYRIYIEHFGLNKDMKNPMLTPIEETKYLEGYHWKINIHAEKKTTLIKTYSYFNTDGILTEKLKELLESHGVKFYERDRADIYKKLYLNNKDVYFEELVKLITTFISLFKSHQFTQADFDHFIRETDKIESDYTRERTHCFLTIAQYVYAYYQQKLIEMQTIDFNDMLNLSAEAIRNGAELHPYKMVIVDEFQDTSLSRFHLVQAILQRTQARFLCVGDDWQSIYRFAGSDLQIFTDFEKFFGHQTLLKIENTYRNPQSLIDIAGAFVMKNQIQYKKNLTSVVKSKDVPITIIGYNTEPIDALKSAIDAIVLRRPGIKEILLIGRNNFDINFLDPYLDFYIKRDTKSNSCTIRYKTYPDIEFSFLTAHRSKGLESEATIILNVNNSLLGFPNKIADDAVLKYVLTQKDSYRFGEERRLFYVALTRTKTFTYILTNHNKRSIFVNELIKDYDVPYYCLDNPNYFNDVVECPKCTTGHLVEHTSGNRKFVGCTNFPGCDYTIHNREILKNPIICPTCGGFLIEKKNGYTHQKFLGCSNHPHCKHTQEMDYSKP